jgi:SAM-dependent methyltransferase
MTAKVSLIGGEMPAWSDHQPDERPAVGGAVLAHLLGLLAPAGGQVLVAGPHDDTLLDVLGERTGVTLLLRSQPDAEAAAARGVPVLCGSLAKLTDADRFDLVVALDGLDRLCSVEGPQYDWADSLQVLERALRPGGTLLLAVENDLGVHRLVDHATPTSPRTSGQWHPVGEFDGSRPGTPGRLTGRLAADGLTVTWLGAAWPLPQEPTVIATREALDEGPGGALAAAVSGAVGAAYADVPVLSDPRRLAAAAVRGGLGPELAASWLVLAHRAPAPAVDPALPPVLMGDGPVVALTHDRDGAWLRTVVGGDRTATAERDPARLEGPLPGGRLLEELLIGACLHYDLPALRRLLTGWATWLRTLDDHQRAYATAENVVLDSDTFVLLDPSRRSTAPIDADTAAVSALRRFADTLLTGGYAHPWPAAIDDNELTAVLTGAAGLAADPDDVVTSAAMAAPPAPYSLRDHEQQVRTLREKLSDQDEQVKWYERQLAGKEQELRKLRRQLKTLHGSRAFKVAKAGLDAARKARNVIRRSGS